MVENQVVTQYHLLIPKKEYASIVLHIHNKIKSKEFEEYFTYEDIEYCINQSDSEKSMQIEAAVQYLLNYFLIKSRTRTNTYRLTQYARNFISLISNKIDSPYRNLPLKKNFEKYFKVNSDDLSSVENLKSWFQLGFDGISKNIISDHIESLYDDLKVATNKLNEILMLEGIEASDQVELFSSIFEKFVLRSREIREVVNLNNTVLTQIGSFQESLFEKYNAFSARQRMENKVEFENYKTDWNVVKEISLQVKVFFNKLDIRLDNITNQILYSSKKLDELGETFERKSLLKVNLKKVLRSALEDTTIVNGEINFKSFPLKAIPYERIYLNTIKWYDFETMPENQIIDLETDETYFNEQNNFFLKDLNNQERISIWIDSLKQRLESERKLDLTTEFYKILNEESSIQIPLSVCYELINNSQSLNKDEISISKVIDTSENKLLLWKISLTRK